MTKTYCANTTFIQAAGHCFWTTLHWSPHKVFFAFFDIFRGSGLRIRRVPPKNLWGNCIICKWSQPLLKFRFSSITQWKHGVLGKLNWQNLDFHGQRIWWNNFEDCLVSVEWPCKLNYANDLKYANYREENMFLLFTDWSRSWFTRLTRSIVVVISISLLV